MTGTLSLLLLYSWMCARARKTGCTIEDCVVDGLLGVTCSVCTRGNVEIHQAAILKSISFVHCAGDSYEGRCVAVAEGHTVGKGPVVFELPAEGVSLVRQRAAAGAPEFVQLEVRPPHPLLHTILTLSHHRQHSVDYNERFNLHLGIVFPKDLLPTISPRLCSSWEMMACHTYAPMKMLCVMMIVHSNGTSDDTCM